MNRVAGLKPRRSAFDLTHNWFSPCDMGVLYPILVEDCMPGDVFRITTEIVVRFHESVWSPVLHEVNVHTRFFFCPYRILWDDSTVWAYSDRFAFRDTVSQYSGMISCPGGWEQFYTRGASGNVEYPLPRFRPEWLWLSAISGKGSIIDYLYGVTEFGATLDSFQYPVLFPLIAYNFIWNEYFRDQDLQSLRDCLGHSFDDLQPSFSNKGLALVNYEKDYFTSASPFRQRGIPPSLPLSGVLGVDFPTPLEDAAYLQGNVKNPSSGITGSVYVNAGDSEGTFGNAYISHDASGSYFVKGDRLNIPWEQLRQGFMPASVSLADALTFTVDDLRNTIQVQRWMERNARAGVRYIENLRAHWGVFPTDERLDRPEYIGGSKSPVIFSEVARTTGRAAGASGSDTAQGYLAGHGLSADRTKVCKYHVKENGVILGLMFIRPRTMYQQGINRMWLRDDVWDYPWPEFMHLSERPVWNQEIFHDPVPGDNNKNRGVFGYQPVYDEYRFRKSTVHGDLRDTLNFWHLGRIFSSLPSLAQTLPVDPVENRRIVPVTSRESMIVNVCNKVVVVRPLPQIGEPGLMDHY
jgi:hypothetical protein